MIEALSYWNKPMIGGLIVKSIMEGLCSSLHPPPPFQMQAETVTNTVGLRRRAVFVVLAPLTAVVRGMLTRKVDVMGIKPSFSAISSPTSPVSKALFYIRHDTYFSTLFGVCPTFRSRIKAIILFFIFYVDS